MSAPAMLPSGPMNPAMPSPVHLANQMGGCFINPAQQFLPQQPNMVWPGGLPPPPHPNMGLDGAALAASIMQNILAGANQFQQQMQNQKLRRFPEPNGHALPTIHAPDWNARKSVAIRWWTPGGEFPVRCSTSNAYGARQLWTTASTHGLRE